nr:AzlC family ABC transporter permease [Tissierella creatinophila]
MPIILGYIPVAMSCGLLSKSSGISIIDTVSMSFFVFAGASQFMAIDMIVQGLSYSSIILATFLLNLRHLMMSASLSLDFKDIERKYIPLVAFGVTDESFSLISFHKKNLSLPFILSLFFSAHAAWWVGNIIGYLVGEVLPKSLQSSMSIGFYAMFAGLLFSQVKENRKVLTLSLISMAIYIFIYGLKIMGSGWDIILGIIISSAIGSFIFGNRGEER